MPSKKKKIASQKKRRVTIQSQSFQKKSKAPASSGLRWTESYTSLLLGIVVVIIGILFFTSLRKMTPVVTKQVTSTSTVITLAQQAVKKTPTPQMHGNTYTVAAGDDLWHISEKVYHSGYEWVVIARANNISNPGMIYKGTNLIIPSLTATPTPTIAPTATSPPIPTIAMENHNISNTNISIKTNTYTVQKGDDLWHIAVRAYADGYRWIDIAKANNLTNPDLIFSGNVLKIPR